MTTVEKRGLKGAQATLGNKERYAAYLEELKVKGEKFPCNQFGTVSIEAVAERVGCTPKVLQKGSLASQFEADVAVIGVEAKKTPDSRLALKAEQKTRENSSLLKQLNMEIKECEALREENKCLADKIRQLEHRQKEDELSLHELLKTGRRFML
jgi:hypothetical protein